MLRLSRVTDAAGESAAAILRFLAGLRYGETAPISEFDDLTPETIERREPTCVAGTSSPSVPARPFRGAIPPVSRNAALPASQAWSVGGGSGRLPHDGIG